MMHKTQLKTNYAVLLALCCLSAAASAEPKTESAGQQAYKKIQGMVRQLTEEKQALAAENAELLAKVTKLEALAQQIAPLQAEVALHKTQADSLRNNNGTLEAQLATEQHKQQDLHRKLKEVVAEAKKIQTDNQLLVAAVQEREHWIKQCGDNNHALIEANTAMLGKYQEKGFWDSVAEMEPITGIGKVASQNTVEAYQFKLQDLKVTDFEPAANGK